MDEPVQIIDEPTTDVAGEIVLPDDLIVQQILCRCPAEKLQTSLRYVCKYIYEQVSSKEFATAQLYQSKPGLLVQRDFLSRQVKYADMDGGICSIRDLNFPENGWVIGSSCGMVLAAQRKAFTVTNPITKKILKLRCNKEVDVRFSGIGLVQSTGRFKVVVGHFLAQRGRFGLYDISWYTRTIGVDVSWRKIDFDLGICLESFYTEEVDRISIGEIIYWARSKKIFCLDLSTETFHQVQTPCLDGISPATYDSELYGTSARVGGYIAMGGNLSLILADSRTSQLIVFSLTDFRHSEWTRRNYTFRNEISERFIDEKAKPVVWSEKDGILICRTYIRTTSSSSYTTVLAAYHCLTGAKTPINTHIDQMYNLFCHTPSLVQF